jgi:hypothetical protein
MGYRKFAAVFFLAVMMGGVSPAAMATMEASEKDESVRKMGVAWNIAQDRKMENIAGVYEPEGMDKYVKRYFDQLSSKLDQLSAKIDKLSTQVAAIGTVAAKKNTSDASSRGRII